MKQRDVMLGIGMYYYDDSGFTKGINFDGYYEIHGTKINKRIRPDGSAVVCLVCNRMASWTLERMDAQGNIEYGK